METDRRGREPLMILVSASDWEYHWADYFSIDFVRIEEKPTTLENNRTLVIDYLSDQTVWDYVEALAARREISACISLKERGGRFAHEVSTRFNLPYSTSENADLIYNKFAMRDHLAANGQTAVPYSRIASADEAVQFVKQNGKSIIKPVDGTGSRQIQIVEDPVATAIQLPDIGKEWIIEKYVTGKEFSVEAFSYDGEHKLVGITEKMVDPVHFVEKMHIFPARIPDPIRDAIWSEVQSILATLGIRNGPTHSEVKVNKEGVFLIETHDRVGGDAIPGLAEMVTGFSLVRTAIGWPVGKVASEDHVAQPHQVAMIKFLFAKAGTVKSVRGVSSAHWIPGIKEVSVYPVKGDTVFDTISTFTRLGHIIATGKTYDDCIASIKEAVDRVKVDISQDYVDLHTPTH